MPNPSDSHPESLPTDEEDVNFPTAVELAPVPLPGYACEPSECDVKNQSGLIVGPLQNDGGVVHVKATRLATQKSQAGSGTTCNSIPRFPLRNKSTHTFSID
jgi:hypothetical protein